MSDLIQKRPRKSKLVPRDEDDTVDDNIVNLEDPTNEEVIKIKEDPVWPGSSTLSTTDMQFSVKIQVEKCTNNVAIPSNIEKKYQQSEILNYEFSKYLKIIESNTLNVADKNLVLYMKNYMGKKPKCPPQSRENKLLEDALMKWSHWKTFNRLREEPLCYKCYICNKAWWHLYPFREHLTEHLEPTLIVNIETLHQTCNVIAHIDSAPEFKSIEMDSCCLKCNMNYEYHSKWLCRFCHSHFYPCKHLRNHEMKCNRREIVEKNFSISLCKLCYLNCDSDKQLEDHMALSHTVRSDVPMANKVKSCTYCDDKYVMHTLHHCSKRMETIACESCHRKFPNNYMLKIHKLYGAVNVSCGMCTTIVPKQCLIVSHWLKHSEHFVYAIRCLICSDIYCPNEFSIKLHKKNFHKFFGKSNYFEKVVVPKQCIEKFNNSDPHVFLYDGTSSNVYKNHNKSQDSVEKEDENVDFLPLIGSVFQDVIKEEPMEVDDKDSQEIDMESIITTNEIKKEIEDMSQTVEETAHQSLDPITGSEHTNTLVHEIKKEIVDEDHGAASTVAATEEEADDNDAFGEFIIKIEENWERQSNGHRKDDVEQRSSDDDLDRRLVIKEEPIDDYEDDLIVLNADIVPENELDASNAKVKSRSVDEKLNIDPEKLLKAGYRKRKIYKCKKCHYQGYHKEYKQHVNTHGKKRAAAAAAGAADDDDDDDDSDYGAGQSDPDDRYPCTQCGRRHGTLRKFLLHLKDHGVPENECPACCMQLGDARALQMHVRGHVSRQYVRLHRIVAGQTASLRSHRCRRCNAAVQRADFFRHWQAHLWERGARGPEPAPAEGGNAERDRGAKPIGNETLLFRVIDQLTSTVPMQLLSRSCIVCKKPFGRFYECKRHLIEHLLADAFITMGKKGGLECPMCKTVLPKPDKYRFHMRNHASLPVYQCSICNKVFSDSSNFTKHKKVHNIGVHVCDICKKKFQAKMSLEKHMMAHEHGPNPCPECGKMFYLRTEMKRHVKKFHRKSEVRHRCPACRMHFPTLRLRWDHQWEVHKMRSFQADCPLCAHSFRKYADLKSHMRSAHGAACPDRRELEAARAGDGTGTGAGAGRRRKEGGARVEVYTGKYPKICIVKCDDAAGPARLPE